MSTESQTHSFEVGSPARLVVKNIRGHVELVPGEDGKIKVEVISHLGDGNPDYTEVKLEQEKDGTVRAEVRVPDTVFGVFNHKPQRIDFKIEAPARTDIRARMVSGSIEAHGFEGEIDLGTVSGSLSLEDLTGQLDLDSVSGKIKGTRLKGRAKLSVVSGHIEMRQCDFPSLKASTVSGKAEVETRLGEGPYKINAVSGSLLLVVPKDANCTVEASAVSGRFYTDLPVSQSQVSKRKWYVRVGEGGPQVEMKAVSGKMRLLSSFDAQGSVPGEVRMSQDQRKDVLSRLSEGEISVEDALRELTP
jgi:DUF4097 and DUF4098 domain-containing protein YvlB